MTLFDLPPAESPGGGGPVSTDGRDGAGGPMPDAAQPTPNVEAAVRLKLLVAYDGRGFRGFATQPGVLTVAGTVAAALATLLRLPAPPDITCAGRTDAGVHAWGQVVHVDVADPVGFDVLWLRRRLTKLVGPAIVIRSIERAPDGFDARRSARWRTYRYSILNRTSPDPWRWTTTWHLPEPLDLRAMQLACDPLIGEHDYSSFCRRPHLREPTDQPVVLVRRVFEAGWTQPGDDLLRFEIRAGAFCHQMVRSIVGTLVDVGLGRLRAGDVASILRARDRSASGQVAPPDGLCLWEVGYPPEA